jgi:hypothetical protein
MAVRLPKSETWIIVPARVNAARLMPRESLAEAGYLVAEADRKLHAATDWRFR